MLAQPQHRPVTRWKMATINDWNRYKERTQMNSNMTSLGTGALLAALMAGWQQVQSIFARVAGLLIVTCEVRSHAGLQLLSYCDSNLRRTPSGFRYFFGRIDFIRPLSKHGTIVLEIIGPRGRLYWKGWKPLWINLFSGNGGEGDGNPERVVLRFIRGTLDLDAFLLDVVDSQKPKTRTGNGRFQVIRVYGESNRRRDQNDRKDRGSSSNAPALSKSDEVGNIGRLLKWNWDDIGESVPDFDPVNRLALTDDVLEVVEHIKRWFRSKDWYGVRNIPWRLGCLFHGPPGTGKSSLAKAIAQTLNIPIYVFDLGSMNNDDFHGLYSEGLLRNTPAMLLIEDIDAVFEGRENVVAEKGHGLTFDCLLNTISGVENSDGVLLVVTTNNLNKVDPALGVPQNGTSTRPGRVDKAIELRALTKAGRIKLAQRILEGCDSSWIDYLVRQGENDTGAQFEDRCATAALELYWSTEPKKPAPVTACENAA